MRNVKKSVPSPNKLTAPPNLKVSSECMITNQEPPTSSGSGIRLGALSCSCRP